MSIDISVDGEIATITLNNPAAMNALGFDDFVALADAFDRLSEDPAVQAIILTGTGKAFCAGAALGSLVDTSGQAITPKELDRAFHAAVNRVSRAMAGAFKPVVIAINGTVAGAAYGIALTGDVVLAARSATFHCGFVPMLGLLPDCGTSWYLPNLLGRNRGLATALLGDAISADEAAGAGMIYRTVEADALAATARDIAVRLAGTPREALLRTRAVFSAATHQSRDDVLEIERQMNVDLIASDELKEGVAAFREKRKPDFRAARRGQSSDKG
jgi:2-(1,2-epoxy-1,2-dihydrophenyl)acetyl-CoA isomerase